MKKKLLTEGIANELEGASLFFTRPTNPPPPEPVPLDKETDLADQPSTIPEESPLKEESKTSIEPKTVKQEKLRTVDTTIPRYHDTMVSSNHASMPPSIHGVTIDIVRKAVKEFGKEAATHRFTESEKKELADLIYTYKNRNIRTSENEITRIAVNFIVQDYEENGENSVLHKILEALNE